MLRNLTQSTKCGRLWGIIAHIYPRAAYWVNVTLICAVVTPLGLAGDYMKRMNMISTIKTYTEALIYFKIFPTFPQLPLWVLHHYKGPFGAFFFL